MNGLSAIRANGVQNMQVQGTRPPGPPPGGMLQGMDETSKSIVNDDGESLFEARDAIMASVRAAMESGDGGPESHRAAMEKSLAENGFDPAEVRSKMGPPPDKGGAGPRGGSALDLAAGTQNLGSLLSSSSYGTADELIQQLLSRLPAGSSLDLEA